MKNKEEFGIAAIGALTFVWLLYSLFGDLGAILYSFDESGGISENILTNLPVSSFTSLMVRWAMACVGLLTYPITLAPAAEMVEHYCTTQFFSITSFLYPSRIGYSAIVRSQPQTRSTTTDNNHTNYFGASQETGFLLRCANRFSLVACTTFIAASLPCFGTVISLLGGFTIAILDFILPPLLHIQIVYYGVHRPLIPVVQYYTDNTNGKTGVAMKKIGLSDENDNDTSGNEIWEIETAALRTREEGGGGGVPSGYSDNGIEQGGPTTLLTSGSMMCSGSNFLYVDTVLLLIGSAVCVFTTVVAVTSIYAKIGQSIGTDAC
eukprot:CAMPEP_0170369330 /NCGR_PEP_ID=MMETSP0117_2-20130122/7925_1 /TAXON_ID=400756 /ORGANISM="Durinskia baltica, Strain CSIRO CS-38" /LENGTH=320 /DNA_ID=CAMNT_0010624041 /DNA_START=816 /DNA_END=1778 /DNA_ORIENTATION=+